jgi:hypothetical protein
MTLPCVLGAVVIIREIGIIFGLVTVGITDVVSPSGLPGYHRYHRETQVIPFFILKIGITDVLVSQRRIMHLHRI